MHSHRITPDILCFATKGAGSNEEERISLLLDPLHPRVWPFQRAHRTRMALFLLRELRRSRPDLVVMEGVGVAGGVPLLAARLAWNVPYVVSSGDAVAPFVAMKSRLLLPLALAYECVLYRLSAGFIGWTPYLTGRALTLGSRHAVTAENWPLHQRCDKTRAEVRARLGLPADVIVFGLVGALVWVRSRGYGYGLDLVRALRRTRRDDVAVVIVGDGSGRERLEEAAGDELGRRVLITGEVRGPEVPAYLSAFDVASLPQSVDSVGAFRYTTKLSEYVAAGLPVVTSRVPLAYDLDDGWLWRLPGSAPWDEPYLEALARMMETVTEEDIASRRAKVPVGTRLFDGARQQSRIAAFVSELLERS